MKVLAIVVLLVAVGCNVGVDYHRPVVAVPDHFGELPTTGPAATRDLATDGQDGHR